MIIHSHEPMFWRICYSSRYQAPLVYIGGFFERWIQMERAGNVRIIPATRCEPQKKKVAFFDRVSMAGKAQLYSADHLHSFL